MSEIEQWAIESGLADSALSSPGNLMTDYGSATDAIIAFAALVRAAERERCARVCEAHAAPLYPSDPEALGLLECAAAIRRGSV